MEPDVVVEVAPGRQLAADDRGDASGRPVLYLHGAPDCRLARHPDDSVATVAGIRLVAVDRPGYGRSDPQPEPDPIAWAADVGRLADHLGVERFALAAWSAGATWAFGVAAALGDRVSKVVTYGCLAPYEAFDEPDVVAASGSRAGVVEELAAGTSLAELTEGMSALLVPPAPVDPALARDLVVESYSARALADLAAVPGVLDQMGASLAEAVDRFGAAGLAADLAVQFEPGFADILGQVGCPVALVHGRHDSVAGPAVGEWLARRLPDATVDVWEQGHQGLLVAWERWLTLAG